MNAISAIWVLTGAASAIVAAIGLSTMRVRTRVEEDAVSDGTSWKRAYHLGAELAGGRTIEANSQRLVELFDESPDRHVLLATAIGVAVRQHPDVIDPSLFSALRRTGLSETLGRALGSKEITTQLEALEIIEVLRIRELLGDAAVLTRSPNQQIARAACDAVVENEPSIGLGILIGLADGDKTWVLDALGRATDKLVKEQVRNVPIARNHWRSAPMFARRALSENSGFDPATVNDAIATLVAALDDESGPKRLAAISALAASIEHPGAQLALSAALGSTDRMTRFAAAASLSDSVQGHSVLRRVAEGDDGSDAARMAAEILWSSSDEMPLPLYHADDPPTASDRVPLPSRLAAGASIAPDDVVELVELVATAPLPIDSPSLLSVS